MPCYHPNKAIRNGKGGMSILPASSTIFTHMLPCGQCVGCRLDRSRQWALRCVHEAKLYEHNCFITLTYDDDHLPKDGSLSHRDFQLFFKRLRKQFPNNNIRYYMCGEYGELNGRPHFHAILFNHTFTDLFLHSKSPSGSHLFRSPTLERLWPFGFASIGAVTFESAAYVSRYVMKKVTGSLADSHYERIDPSTGEIIWLKPEYNRMSLKPGIGASFYHKYKSDIFPHDRVVHDGTEHRVPRYYDKLLSRSNPELLEEIKSQRIIDIQTKSHDNTTQRLNSKEIVQIAQLNQLKRRL